MKQVLESHLLHLVMRIYKATTLFKTFWKFFVFTYFLMRFLPPHGGVSVKTQVSILRPGYIMRIEGWKICIKLTKLPKYCCNNKKYLVFYTSARAVFLKETSHREWWKYHFWASRFQNFPEEDAPRPPIQLFVNSRLPRSFGSPLPPPPPPPL